MAGRLLMVALVSHLIAFSGAILRPGSAFAAPAPAGAGVAAGIEPALYDLIAERLGLMRDVAAFKWLNDRPVEDLSREALVIEAAVADGLRLGIRPEASERFFRVQIEAAKDIQRYWFARWTNGPAPLDAPDLGVTIRPRLLLLGEAILSRSVVAGSTHSRAAFGSAIASAGIGESLDEERTDALFDALIGIRRFDSRLAQILVTGVLRVGTTGDYAPFSLSDARERAIPASSISAADDFSGIDIDLAEDLAGALGVQLQLVKTSWPTLLDDLAEGRYDVGMSGISRTLQRARVGYLSAPYYVGGKTAIARCEDGERFASLAAIDQSGVRVIVNPGGTNEAFVDQRLQAAEKVLHQDNRTIFAALAAGGADVMITDRIEVALQARLNPALCGTMAATLTYQEKGFLMPQDEKLKTFVDTWLGLRLRDGTVETLIQRHLDAN